MGGMAEQHRVPHERIEDHFETATVRRAPRYSAFLGLGAALGILTALVLTFGVGGAIDISPATGLEYSDGQVFGFLALICIPIGLVIGGTVALILDRAAGRRARSVTVDRETIRIVE